MLVFEDNLDGTHADRQPHSGHLQPDRSTALLALALDHVAARDVVHNSRLAHHDRAVVRRTMAAHRHFGGRLQAQAVLAELSHGLGHNASSTKAQTCRARPQTSGKKLGRRGAGWRTYPLWRNRSISIPGLSHCRKRCAAPSKGATFGPLAYEDCRSRLLRGRTPHPGATCQRAEWLMLQLV